MKDTIIEQGLKFYSQWDKDSKKEMRSEIERFLRDDYEIDFNTKQGIEDLKVIADAFRSMFDKAGVSIDWEGILSKGATEALENISKIIQSQFADVMKNISANANIIPPIAIDTSELNKEKQAIEKELAVLKQREELLKRGRHLLNAEQANSTEYKDEEGLKPQAKIFHAYQWKSLDKESIIDEITEAQTAVEKIRNNMEQTLMNGEKIQIQQVYQAIEKLSVLYEMRESLMSKDVEYKNIAKKYLDSNRISVISTFSDDAKYLDLQEVIERIINSKTNGLNALQGNISNKETRLQEVINELSAVESQANKTAASIKEVNDAINDNSRQNKSGGIKQVEIKQAENAINGNIKTDKDHSVQSYYKAYEDAKSGDFVERSKALLNFINAYNKAVNGLSDEERESNKIVITYGELVQELGQYVDTARQSLQLFVDTAQNSQSSKRSSVVGQHTKTNGQSQLTEENEKLVREEAEILEKENGTLEEKIQTYEELCKVIERYNELMLKSITEGQQLTKEEEAELKAINDRIDVTKGVTTDPDAALNHFLNMTKLADQLTGSLNPAQVAKYLGIEVPQETVSNQNDNINQEEKLRLVEEELRLTKEKVETERSAREEAEQYAKAQEESVNAARHEKEELAEQLNLVQEELDIEKSAREETEKKVKADEDSVAEAAKLREELSHKVDAQSGSFTSISIEELKNLLSNLVYNVNIQDKQNVIQELLAKLANPSRKNEYLGLLNSRTGAISDEYFEGGNNHASGTFKNKDGYDTMFHNHPDVSTAIPGQADWDAFLNSFDNFKKQIIVTKDEIATFDFSQLTKKGLEQLIQDINDKIAHTKYGVEFMQDAQKYGKDEANQIWIKKLTMDVLKSYPGIMQTYDTNTVLGTSLSGLREKSNGIQQNVSINPEEIKGLLESIVYQVKISDGADTSQPWAREDTLGTVKGVLEHIQTNTSKIGEAKTQQIDLSRLAETLGNIKIQSPITADVGNVLATENTLNAVKTAVESINSKVVGGTKVNAGQSSRSTSKTDYTGSPFFGEKLKTREMELAKFAQQLTNSGKETDELRDKVQKLKDLLSEVKNGENLSIWDQLFKQTKLSSNITDLINNPQAYKNLIAYAKEYYSIVEKYEKAKEGSSRKQKLGEQRQNMEEFMSQNGISLSDIQLADDIYNKKLSDMREKHNRNLEVIAADREDTNRAKQEADAIKQRKAEEDAAWEAYRAEQEVEAKKQNEMRKTFEERENLLAKEEYDIQKVTQKEIEAYYKAADEKTELARKTRESEEEEAWKSYEVEQKADAKKQEEIRKSWEAREAATAKEEAAIDEATRKEIDEYYKEEETEKIKKENQALKELQDEYEKLGKLEAQSQYAKGEKKKEIQKQIESQKNLIKTKREELSVEEALYNPLRVEAYKKEVDKLSVQDAAKIDKEEASRIKTENRQEVQLSKAQAGVNLSGSVLKKGQNVLYGANTSEFSDEAKAKIDDYVKKLNELDTTYERIKKSDTIVSDEDKQKLIEQTQTVSNLTPEIKELINEYERLSGLNATVIGDNTLGTSKNLDAIKQQLTDVVMASTNGKASIQGFNYETGELTYVLKTGKNEFTTYTAAIRHADDAIVSVAGNTKKTEGIMDAIKRKTREIMTYFVGSASIGRVISEIKRGITYVREIDSAMVELRKVTEATEETYTRVMKNASKIAAEVGSTMKDVISSEADFARLGYSIADAEELSKTAQILMNVSEFTDINTATDSLISALKGFDYSAQESLHVVDIFNTIGEILLI